MHTIIFTFLALIAFAANSILCRAALGQGLIDPAGFTIIRLLSGVVTLYFIYIVDQKFNVLATNPENKMLTRDVPKGSWFASLCLFFYAITFSYAYIYLDTGTGALILFGAVQIFMILYSIFTKTVLSVIEWVGLSLAFSGFVYLIYPSINTPSVLGFVLMTISGFAWAAYTLMGKKSSSPLVDTCYNFFRTIPFVLILTVVSLTSAEYSIEGIWLAVASGAIMSGIGYSIWYVALNGLSATQAGVLQLLVPIIAAVGGIVFMDEIMTDRLVISMATVVGGIALVLFGKKTIKKTSATS